jgi:hypothetical protein
MHQAGTPLVDDIHKDLASVVWRETSIQARTVGWPEGARSFSGVGARWLHNLIIWPAEDGDRCDGTAVSLSEAKGLIVHYTSEIALTALGIVKEKFK